MLKTSSQHPVLRSEKEILSHWGLEEQKVDAAIAHYEACNRLTSDGQTAVRRQILDVASTLPGLSSSIAARYQDYSNYRNQGLIAQSNEISEMAVALARQHQRLSSLLERLEHRERLSNNAGLLKTRKAEIIKLTRQLEDADTSESEKLSHQITWRVQVIGAEIRYGKFVNDLVSRGISIAESGYSNEASEAGKIAALENLFSALKKALNRSRSIKPGDASDRQKLIDFQTNDLLKRCPSNEWHEQSRRAQAVQLGLSDAQRQKLVNLAIEAANELAAMAIAPLRLQIDAIGVQPFALISRQSLYANLFEGGAESQFSGVTGLVQRLKFYSDPACDGYISAALLPSSVIDSLPKTLAQAGLEQNSLIRSTVYQQLGQLLEQKTRSVETSAAFRAERLSIPFLALEFANYQHPDGDWATAVIGTALATLSDYRQAIDLAIRDREHLMYAISALDIDPDRQHKPTAVVHRISEVSYEAIVQRNNKTHDASWAVKENVVSVWHGRRFDLMRHCDNLPQRVTQFIADLDRHPHFNQTRQKVVDILVGGSATAMSGYDAVTDYGVIPMDRSASAAVHATVEGFKAFVYNLNEYPEIAIRGAIAAAVNRIGGIYLIEGLLHTSNSTLSASLPGGLLDELPPEASAWLGSMALLNEASNRTRSLRTQFPKNDSLRKAHQALSKALLEAAESGKGMARKPDVAFAQRALNERLRRQQQR